MGRRRRRRRRRRGRGKKKEKEKWKGKAEKKDRCQHRSWAEKKKPLSTKRAEEGKVEDEPNAREAAQIQSDTEEEPTDEEMQELPNQEEPGRISWASKRMTTTRVAQQR